MTIRITISNDDLGANTEIIKFIEVTPSDSDIKTIIWPQKSELFHLHKGRYLTITEIEKPSESGTAFQALKRSGAI